VSGARRSTRPFYDPVVDEFVETPVYDGTALRPGNLFAGPAVVEYPLTTVALVSGQQARVDELLGISITRSSQR
jgi:N-methylhydantoinase A